MTTSIQSSNSSLSQGLDSSIPSSNQNQNSHLNVNNNNNNNNETSLSNISFNNSSILNSNNLNDVENNVRSSSRRESLASNTSTSLKQKLNESTSFELDFGRMKTNEVYQLARQFVKCKLDYFSSYFPFNPM